MASSNSPEYRDLITIARLVVHRARIDIADGIEVTIPYNVYVALDELVDAIDAGTYSTKWQLRHDLRENPEDQERPRP